ncbi:DUF3089 domain-containing protein [Ginsengibacter hankyongi]|uniref:DUF3089 domain-containing protein n=1 Tax=Ginsengibacter hankyongi TaxID=2607284 RepID=A0A5J5IPP9_9BACT|nr:DUF3089 domain-containing protein [Ginsengibacter hankyongi]
MSMTNYKRNFLLRVLIIVILFVPFFYTSSCTTQKYIRSINYNFKKDNSKPDYSKLNYWAAHPFKYDPSDNIPKGIKDKSKDSLADVFFIYPTTYTDKKMPMGWNAGINNKKLNKKTDNSTILYQASVFNKYCRVFAPRYRQANIGAFYTLDTAKGEEAFNTAYEDVKAAFIFYLKNYNNGRPIIIASHSQGTLHAGRLLKEFFEGKPLQKQLVCAYIIGLPVFDNYFSQLKPCSVSTATGCFISWRTFKEGYTPGYVKEETLKADVINPLTWTMDTTKAPVRLNKGAVLKNFKKENAGLVHAQIHKNILWVNKPKFFGSVFLRIKNYHIADYNLFYENIRENVGTRIYSFLERNKRLN